MIPCTCPTWNVRHQLPDEMGAGWSVPLGVSVFLAITLSLLTAGVVFLRAVGRPSD